MNENENEKGKMKKMSVCSAKPNLKQKGRSSCGTRKEERIQ